MNHVSQGTTRNPRRQTSRIIAERFVKLASEGGRDVSERNTQKLNKLRLKQRVVKSKQLNDNHNIHSRNNNCEAISMTIKLSTSHSYYSHIS